MGLGLQVEEGKGLLSVMGVGVGVGEQSIGNVVSVSAFAECGTGPGKCIPHQTNTAVKRKVTAVLMKVRVFPLSDDQPNESLPNELLPKE